MVVYRLQPSLHFLKTTRLVVKRSGGSLVWEENLVNDVDDSVVALDTHVDDSGRVGLATVHEGFGGVDSHLNRDFLAVEGIVSSSVTGRSLLTSNNVVGEDGGELRDVLKKSIDSSGRKLGEGSISRGEDGERSLSLKSVDQLGSSECGSEGLNKYLLSQCKYTYYRILIP